MFIAGSPQLEVGTDHHEVLAAIEEEANHARIAEFPITVDMYMTALKEGIKEARERTKEVNPGGTRYVKADNIYTKRVTVVIYAIGWEDGCWMDFR